VADVLVAVVLWFSFLVLHGVFSRPSKVLGQHSVVEISIITTITDESVQHSLSSNQTFAAVELLLIEDLFAFKFTVCESEPLPSHTAFNLPLSRPIVGPPAATFEGHPQRTGTVQRCNPRTTSNPQTLDSESRRTTNHLLPRLHTLHMDH
jgi:hypothetical protein